ncbi:hypothetical protein FIU87_17115 [Bacillus sp. THAF10]|nr:hypothetical protein FIU87_17115 [Bacillus sp. THAF10]
MVAVYNLLKWEIDPYLEYLGFGAIVYKHFLLQLIDEEKS